MAIEKTVFTATTMDARATEIYNWLILNANAADYFDEISIDDNAISCKIGTVTALSIPISDSAVTVTLANGTQIKAPYSGDYVACMYDYAVKTDNGIFLHYPAPSGGWYNMHVMIAKANDDTICFSCQYKNGYDNIVNFVANFTASSAAIDVSSAVTDQNMTTYSPIVYGVNCYSDKMLLTNFTQHKGTVCVLTDSDGAKYVYNGYTALKE